jgi:GWxTD domain-containing protein
VPARAAADGPGPLPWRTGGSLGFTVDAVSFPDSASARLEVYLRLRPSTLSRIAQSRTHEPWIRLTLRVREGGRRGRTLNASQELAIAPSDTGAGFGRVVVFPFRVRPGVHELEVRAESRRFLLPGTGTGRPDVVKIAGPVVVPERQGDRDISDVEFVWAGADRAAPPVFERGGVGRLPNPEHLYGLFGSELRASFRACGGRTDRPWRWVARVHDAAGAVVAEHDTSGPSGAHLDADLAIDVSTLPAGGYVLEVKAWQEGDAGALLRRARFSVGWDPETWFRDPGEILDEAHLILPRGEEEAFAQLQPGEQERRLQEFWRERDPTPDTAENEARDMFRRRVAFANETYGRAGIGRGMFSDMGRVYIRLGEPSEVHRQVMPGRDNELAGVINRLLTVQDRPIGDLQTQPGADMRPFEIWIYEGEIEMPFEAGLGTGPRRLAKPVVFLFIDDQWLGDYRLRYSTE